MIRRSKIRDVSDTAYWVAYFRAKETERADRLFKDPLAKVLLGKHGRKISRSMKPVARYANWVLVIRTCLIDRYIRDYVGEGIKTIINMGAGLDTRPYRLNLGSDVNWIELDFPKIIQKKNEKLKDEKPYFNLERIGVDLTNRGARKQILNEINTKHGPALILTEGVIPYLTEAHVKELAEDLKNYNNFKYWIAENYNPEAYPLYKFLNHSRLLSKSPFKFFPKDWFSFFKEHGWDKKEVNYLYDEGERLGRKIPVPFLRLFSDNTELINRIRVSGFTVFEKI